MARIPSEHQLVEVVVTISNVEYGDRGEPFASTRVYRYDVEGAYVPRLLQAIGGLAVEGGRMRNE